MPHKSDTQSRAPIIILHGLGSGAWSMYMLAARLKGMGFDVEILCYRSQGQSLTQMTDEVEANLPDRLKNKFDIVAHSLGGLVGHQLAKRLGPGVVSKVVMLGTPFLGTRAAGVLLKSRLARFIYGPIWRDLLPAERRIHDVPIEGIQLGMIAGVIPGTRFLPRGASDGLIPLAATKGRAFKHHHITLPASHATLLMRKLVADRTSSFLQFGHFSSIHDASHSDGSRPEQAPAACQHQPSF